MRTRLLMIFFATLLCGAAQAETLRVMTYNIRYPNPQDGANYWDNRREAAIDMLRTYSPDIFGTQELFFRQGDDIVKALPEYVWLGNSRQGVHSGEYMGVFFKKDRFELLEMGQFWLSETPTVPASESWNVSLPRMVTWVRMKDKKTGKLFYFLDTHFAHRPQDDNARTESAKLIADFVKKLPSDIPVLLTGDFNASSDTNAHKVLTGVLTDAWDKAADRKGPVGTFHGFTGKERPGNRIDWILFRAPWKVKTTETVTVHAGEHYPSDHYPVVADFEIQ